MLDGDLSRLSDRARSNRGAAGSFRETCWRFALGVQLGSRTEGPELPGCWREPRCNEASQGTESAQGDPISLALRDLEMRAPRGAAGLGSRISQLLARPKRRAAVRFPTVQIAKASPGSFRLTGRIRVAEKAVRLPRLGWVHLKERGYVPIEGVRVLSATITEQAGRWFVSIGVEQHLEDQRVDGPVVGVDLGILRWITISDGTVCETPAAAARLERRLNRRQRTLSRKRKNSRNRRKASLAV